MKADAGQMDQVILNLAVNARDAMPHGGKLTLETHNVILDEDYAQQHLSLESGSYVVLAISDTGCGMDAETLLVVEDDELVRKLTCQALRHYGYQVVEAANGGEALLACEKLQGPISLMITDVVMPQMSGRELADRLHQPHPEMRVLYMSGYTDDAVIRHGLLDTTMFFLQKPFTPSALAHKVREVLDQ